MTAATGRVLITGATGFVGQHLRVAMAAAGVPIRLASRRPSEGTPDATEWVHFDLEDPQTMDPALEGCSTAFYLVHQIRSAHDYVGREIRAAEAFARAAQRMGVQRIVYLGGVAPVGKPSPHLESRLRTGEALRSSGVPTVELRAAMIIGFGSVSWKMVRDLAARLPAMVVPQWLRFHSWPVGIDDAITALLATLKISDDSVGCYDLPGPERIRHQDILRRTAERFGKRPLMLDVPVLTPKLSSYWIRLVTDVDLRMARELVQGLTSDLDPRGPLFWPLMTGRTPTPINQAITDALADELRGGIASDPTRQRMMAIGAEFAS